MLVDLENLGFLFRPKSPIDVAMEEFEKERSKLSNYLTEFPNVKDIRVGSCQLTNHHLMAIMIQSVISQPIRLVLLPQGGPLKFIFTTDPNIGIPIHIIPESGIKQAKKPQKGAPRSRLWNVIAVYWKSIERLKNKRVTMEYLWNFFTFINPKETPDLDAFKVTVGRTLKYVREYYGHPKRNINTPK